MKPLLYERRTIMPTPREEIGDRMLFAVDALMRDKQTKPEIQNTEFWAALRSFAPSYLGGMLSMNIDAHGNVNMTFLKNQNKK
jgi:hypothetical protein